MDYVRRYKIWSLLTKYFSVSVLTVIAGILAYVILAEDSGLRTENRPKNPTAPQKEPGYEAYVGKPLFKGFSKDFESYEIKAEKVVKSKNLGYDLSEIKAFCEGNPDKALSLSSRAGFLDENRSSLELYGSAAASMGGLGKIKSDSISLDLKNKYIKGDRGIFGKYGNCFISGDAFTYDSLEGTFDLKGHVETKIIPY